MKQYGYGLSYKSHLSSDDVVYSSGMPLYHSAAGGIGTGMMLQTGCCQVIRKKFSAKEWLNDIRKYKATVCQYIGELCRYVLSQKVRPDDADNTLRIVTGNGLSKEIWVEFQTRFGIDTVVEFYGATESNFSTRVSVHLENLKRGDHSGVGCIGRLPEKNPLGLRFIKYDVDEDTLVRDPKTGGLVDCALNEPGECIAPIQEDRAMSKFVGYNDEKATKSKLLEDRGKTYVRSGDLLQLSEGGWIRFVDRIGDTFRWRGENVSTNEVASELNKCRLIEEANVYGVKVPHVEGRAGMAAIRLAPQAPDVGDAVDEILVHARENLPSYSVPLFLRIQTTTVITQTFKHQKVQLRKDGIDPKASKDLLFWLHPAEKRYRPFLETDYQRLKNPLNQSRL
mmetsp:Transcript_19628/g.32275  ORF Transcript_19628/g.32275 Transcript_19628/m.32275 type:complete len:395 (+) Transcript_19628:2-1186(+)